MYLSKIALNVYFKKNLAFSVLLSNCLQLRRPIHNMYKKYLKERYIIEKFQTLRYKTTFVHRNITKESCTIILKDLTRKYVLRSGRKRFRLNDLKCNPLFLNRLIYLRRSSCLLKVRRIQLIIHYRLEL